MEKSRSNLYVGGLVIIVLIAFAAITYGNFNYVIQTPGANDFLPRWAGTRYFLKYGWSPYDIQTSREAQIIAYGRSAQTGEDPLYFLYPLHSFFLYSPFALVADLNIATSLWMTALELSVILIGVIALNLSRWKLPPGLSIVLVIFGLVWYFSARPIMDGSVAVVCALFITAAFLAIRSEQDILAGFLLAVASIKPQMILLLLAFIFIWAISTRRWMLIWSYVGSLVLLVATSFLLMPDWFMQNLRQVYRYFENAEILTPGSILAQSLRGVGKQIGWLLTGIMTVVLLLEWRAALGKGFRWFLWTAYLTLVITILIGVPTTPENFIVLLPALMLILTSLGNRWGIIGRVILIMSILILTIGFWAIYLSKNASGITPDNDPVMYLVLPVVILIGLYWIRWWAIHTRRLPMQELAERLG